MRSGRNSNKVTGVTITGAEIDSLYELLKTDAESGGYNLNPDAAFTKQLIQGILTNDKRYGYRSCPCRLASGNEQDDLDIICPCDYRDPDLNQFGCCYCGLYVSDGLFKDISKLASIPERRLPPQERPKLKTEPLPAGVKGFSLPVWRCRVCGYLCARDAPPENCPICKVTNRFERFG
jgi:ferredoxin-thioredoxin reductase catalytic subunit